MMDGPELNTNINEYNPEFEILNDRSDKASSGVWKHFGAIKHNGAIDKKHVYCIHCFYNRQIKKYQRSTSTGNLNKHLRKQHNISLNQTFRVKKDSDNSIHLIKKESEGESDEKELTFSNSENGDEFLVHDINEILISEVAKRPMLYRTHTSTPEKGAKHIQRRQQWNEVYESLNRLIPLAKIPKIWKNIRDRYHKVRRLANIEGDARPKYRYYDLLRFLDANDDDDEKSFDKSSSPQYEPIEEETDVSEYLVSGDHDHYISTQTIVLPNDGVTYEEISCEPKTKRSRTNPKKAAMSSYQVINPKSNVKSEPNTVGTSNIIEASFVDATSNDIYTTYEEELVTEDVTESEIQPRENTAVEMITTAANNATVAEPKKDDFDIFGNFVAEVLRNMSRPRMRMLQMNIMKVIADAEGES